MCVCVCARAGDFWSVLDKPWRFTEQTGLCVLSGQLLSQGRSRRVNKRVCEWNSSGDGGSGSVNIAVWRRGIIATVMFLIVCTDVNDKLSSLYGF